MSGKVLYRSFAGGEITSELAGRTDLTKFQTGLSLCRNFITLPHGPAARRPGFEFVREAQDSTRPVRLMPFSFSADQTVVLEFGHGYVRFHIDGGTLIDPGTSLPYSLATPYDGADVFDLHFAQSSDIITIVHPGYAARELARNGAINWTLTAITFAPPSGAPAGLTVTPTVAQNLNLTQQTYVVTAVRPDGVTESLASAPVTASNNLTLAGNFNTVTWAGVAGATRYNVYKLRGGVYGYLGQVSSPALTLVDDNVLPDTSQSPPEDIIGLNTGAGDYPATVMYYEQRRWFGGTNSKPQVVWATRTGTEANLTSSLPSRDADGMELRVAAMQNNQIRHLCALSDLMALTAGGEFRIGAGGDSAITPSSVSVKPQGYSGASNVQPIVTSGSLLYVQAQGSRIRELGYNWESNSYRTLDVSIMAPHRFNGYVIKQIAYTRAPDQIMWAVRDDGTLLGLTYVPDQQVFGWHAHDTDGAIESVCVVAEANEDVLYVVVRRFVNGTYRRYVERLRTRLFTQLSDAFFVDSGLSYSGVPITTLSGLGHLEGKVVDILTDGAVHPRKTVTGGAVTLDYPASKVSIGLPYTSDMRTLPLAIESAQAAGQGTVKNVNKVYLRVSQSSVVQAGPTFTRLREYPARAVTDPYGSPPALRDGELALTIDPSWNPDAAICVRQDLPLPLTVLSMTLEVVTGG